MPLWCRDCLLLSLAAPTYLSPVEDGLVCSQLALLSPVFRERAWKVWTFHSIVLSLSLSLSLSSSLSLAIPQSGLLSHISSLSLPLGHSGLVLTLSIASHASLSSPCLLVMDMSVWAASPLGVSVRLVICGFYLFIFPPSYVAL